MKQYLLAASMAMVAFNANAAINEISQQQQELITHLCLEARADGNTIREARICSGVQAGHFYTVLEDGTFFAVPFKATHFSDSDAAVEYITEAITDTVVVDQLTADLADANNMIGDLERDLESKETTIVTLTETITVLQEAVADDSALQALRDRIFGLELQVAALEAELASERARHALTSAQLAAAQGDLATANAEIERLNDIINSHVAEDGHHSTVVLNADGTVTVSGINAGTYFQSQGDSFDFDTREVDILAIVDAERPNAGDYANVREFRNALAAWSQARRDIGYDQSRWYVHQDEITEKAETASNVQWYNNNNVNTGQVSTGANSLTLSVSFNINHSLSVIRDEVERAITDAWQKGFEAGYVEGYYKGYDDGFRAGVASVDPS